jgi:hypothetical protein
MAEIRDIKEVQIGDLIEINDPNNITVCQNGYYFVVDKYPSSPGGAFIIVLERNYMKSKYYPHKTIGQFSTLFSAGLIKVIN